MIIRCQERYDQVVEYAKSIGDTTFQNCIERLKQWETNHKAGIKLNCIMTVPHIHSGLQKWQKTEEGVLSEDCCIMEYLTSLLL